MEIKKIEKLKYYLELMRLKNCLTAFFGTFVAGLIGSNFNIFDYFYPILLSSTVVYLICAYGNVLNDIYDVDIDKINKPERPLPSKKVSLKEAWLFSLILLLIGLILSLFNIWCFIVALFNSIVLYLYAKKYKKNKIIGNIMVAYLTGSIFLFGGISVNNIRTMVILFLCAFFATWGREIIKDYEDITGDKLLGVVSLPIKYGKKSLYIASLLIIISIILSPIPYFLGIFGRWYLYLIILCDILFLYTIYKILKNPDEITCSKVSKYIKIIMNLVLLSYMVGAIFH